jgi:hypothetical protein
MVTDNAGNSIYINNPYFSELFKINGSGGMLTSNVLEVSTNVLLSVIVAFDIDTLSSRYSNDQVVGLRISNDYQATAWLIKEYDSQPLSNDILWKYDRPVEHVFWNNKNEVKTLYLWTKDQTSKVSPQSVMTRITYDTIDPWIESIIVGNQGHMNIGTFNITINLSEIFDTKNATTPSFWMTINGVRRELVYNVSGAYSFITSSIVVTSGMAGIGMFYAKISDNANNPGTVISFGSAMVFDFTSPNIDYLFIQDMDTGGMLYTNEREIKLFYKVTEPPPGEVYRWYVTENTGVVIDNYFQDWFAEAPVTYRMSEVQGTKNIVLWVMDKAYNTKFMAGTIIYDSTVSPNIPGVTVDISMHPMAIVTGTVFVTLNIDNIESGIFATPSFYVLMDVGQSQIPIAISGLTRNGMIYKYYGSFVVNTNSGDGPARFVMQARTRAFEDFSAISSIRFDSNDFQNRLIINTIVKIPTINVYDLDLSAQRNNTYDASDVWTNDQTIGVSIGNDEQAVAWLLNEDQSASPGVSSSFWVSERPVKYTFKNYINEQKTLYLWTKNFNNQISSMRAVITINYDDTQPYVASIEMPNNGYFTGGAVVVTINLSESVQTTPNFMTFIGGSDVTFNLVKINNVTYLVTWSISQSIQEGTYQWTVDLVDRAGNSGAAIVAGRLFYLDRSILPPTFFTLKDKDTTYIHKTNDLVVDVDMASDPDHVAWMMGEEFGEENIGSPNRNSAGWRYVKPVEYYFNNFQSGHKKVYLWVMDRVGHIITHSTLASIEYVPGEREGVNYVIVQTSGGNSFFPGDYMLTFNIFEVNPNTPDISFIWPDGREQILSLNFVSTDNIYGTYYSSSISVSRDESLIGDAYFSISVNRSDDGTPFRVYSIDDAREMLAGDSVVHVYVPSIKLVTFNRLVDSVMMGEAGARIMSFQLQDNTSFLGMETIRITVTGQIYDSDTAGVYLVKRNNDVIDSRTVLTNTGFLTKNTTLLSFFNNPEIPGGGATIYELVMNVSSHAISSNFFSVIISTSDLLVDGNLEVDSEKFPINSGPIYIARRKSDILLGRNPVPTINVRMGESDIVLYDLSIQALQGNGSFSGFILNKSSNITDNIFSNIRLYKKRSMGGEYQFIHDELLAYDKKKINAHDNKIYIENSRIYVNFSPFQIIEDTQQQLYIVADIGYTSQAVQAFNLSFSSTSSFLVGNDSSMLPVVSSNHLVSFNLLSYIPRVSVRPMFMLDDALFEQTTSNKVLDMYLRTDYELTTVSAIIITVDYSGVSVDRLTAVLTLGNEELYSGAISSGRHTLGLARGVALNEAGLTLSLFVDVGAYSPSTVKLTLSDGCVIASPSISLSYTYNTTTINIKSSAHPRKPKARMANYFNTVVSFNLLASVDVRDASSNVKLRLVNAASNEVVLTWTVMIDVVVSSGSSLLSLPDKVARFLTVYNIPLEQAEAYNVELKLINSSNLESDVFVKVVTADLTRPVFASQELSVSQLPNQFVHSVLWGVVNEDVSAVTRVEVWSRKGEDPRWLIVNVATPNASGVINAGADIGGLHPYTSYYYKAYAYNSAGLISDALLKQGSIQTSLPPGMLTKLSNYPNPFNSNIKDTTITYFLNRDMDLTIKVYNIFGKKVYERYCFAGQNGGKEGNNELIWDGTDQSGHKLPMGSYPMIIYDGSAKTILDQWVIGVIH